MKEKEMIRSALNIWANYIETGTVNLSLEDAIKNKKYDEIKSLNDDQKNLVANLRALADKQIL